MPVMQGSISVPANAVSANVLAGELFEFLARASRIVLFTTGSATGLNATLLVGGLAFANDQAISLQNRFPIVPDDFFVDAGGFPGERLILTFRNTTGAALTAFFKVEVNAVA